MKRLWVQLSIIIAGVVVFVSLFPFLSRAAGIRPAPPRRGFVDISPERRAEIEAEFETRVWTQVYKVLITGAALGVVGGVLLSRWLAKPLKDLENGALAIANRQLDHRVPLSGSMELQSVAKSFNQMASTLEEAEGLRQNLLADVAHELRHPVHILQGNLQAILDGVYDLNMEEVGNLLEETQHLTNLVNDLYEIAQAEARQLPLQKTSTDINSLVLNTVEAYQPMAANQDIRLSASVPKNNITAIVDGSRIRQALQNVISNAINHTPPTGKVTVTLDMAQSDLADTLFYIHVTDTGTGIPPEHIPRVFDRFYRADPNRSRGSGGSGLGLAITQAFIQAHGGSITAESPGFNQGSKFTIQLPLKGFEKS